MCQVAPRTPKVVGKMDKKETLTSRAKKGSLKVPVLALLALSACLLSVRTVRWNVALALYMPLLAGFPFELEFLRPVYDAWVEFELQSAHTFVNPSGPNIREIQAKDYSWDELMRVTENLRYPAVVRGLMTDAVAQRTFGSEEWGQKYGQFPVKESVPKAGYKYEYGIEEKRNFSEFLVDIRAGQYAIGYGLDEMFVRNKELVKHLEYERIHEKGSNLCRTMALFASSGGPGLRWHNENHMNIGTQILGSKTWSFTDPEFIPLLSPEGNIDPYSTGYSFRASKRIHDMVPQMSTTINPGDVTVSTTWLLHRVESHGDPDSNICFLNTCRMGLEKYNPIGAVATQPVLELFHHMRSVNWLDPAIPSFLRFIPYFHVLQENYLAITGKMGTWDDDACFSSKGQACRKQIEARGLVINDKDSKTR